ncbi:hypothetical protein ACOSP7_031813 [Xanthoceras sorbifolium]
MLSQESHDPTPGLKWASQSSANHGPDSDGSSHCSTTSMSPLGSQARVTKLGNATHVWFYLYGVENGSSLAMHNTECNLINMDQLQQNSKQNCASAAFSAGTLQSKETEVPKAIKIKKGRDCRTRVRNHIFPAYILVVRL